MLLLLRLGFQRTASAHPAAITGRPRLALALILLLACSNFARLFAEETSEGEQQLIAILKSPASFEQKNKACAELKKVGTPECIPAVAALLADESLAHSARSVLEPMAFPEAGKALISALDHTTGENRVAIIGSLGMRQEKAAAGVLAKLLAGPDLPAARAAATALGNINSSTAERALKKALDNGQPEIRDAVSDACLRTAARSLASGHNRDAKSLYQAVLKSTDSRRDRVAACAGLIRANGKAGVSTAIAALKSNDELQELAALSIIHDLNYPGSTKALADALPFLSPSVQIGVAQCLGQRSDPAAAGRIADLVMSASPDVQMAALIALGSVGGPAEVKLLAHQAATLHGAAQAAARAALVDLRHGEVLKELLLELETAGPQAQPEIARALGNRREKSAVPQLIRVAQGSSESARRAALQALPPLVQERDLPALVQLVATAPSEQFRASTVEALNAAYQNLQTSNGKVDASALAEGITKGSKETKIALLSVCSGLTNSQARELLRANRKSSDTDVRSAAILALCDSSDPELLPDVTSIACEEKEPKLRTAAIQAAVRLSTQEEGVKLSPARKLAVLRKIAAASPDTAQTKMLLAGLGEIPTGESFALVKTYLPQAEVRLEAQLAAVKIAARLTGPGAKTVIPELKELAAHAASPDIGKNAKDIVDALQTAADYITSWEIAGPFQQKGKDYSVLFDIPFPPEPRIKPVKVSWHPMPLPGPEHPPYIMDLLKSIGGNQRVAYARTVIESPVEQRVRLELGSDDGLKVWVNGEQVLATNTSRPLTPGSDKVDVHLKKGANDLLLKITQNNQGWEFCARVVSTNGQHLEGLKIAANTGVKTAAK